MGRTSGPVWAVTPGRWRRPATPPTTPSTPTRSSSSDPEPAPARITVNKRCGGAVVVIRPLSTTQPTQQTTTQTNIIVMKPPRAVDVADTRLFQASTSRHYYYYRPVSSGPGAGHYQPPMYPTPKYTRGLFFLCTPTPRMGAHQSWSRPVVAPGTNFWRVLDPSAVTWVRSRESYRGRRRPTQSTPSTINNMTATLAIFVFIFIKRKET